jgi:recombination protein RecT
MAKGLEDRVAAKAEGSGAEVATRQGPTLQQRIERMAPELQRAMPRGAEAQQLVRDMLTVVRMTPKLAECHPDTVLGGLMTIAQLGLRPGVLGHAWLLPLWSGRNSRFEAQLIIGYQGMVELAYRTGQIKSLTAHTVYENDEFQVSYGIDDTIVHRPQLNGDRGKPIAYYAVAKFYPPRPGVDSGHAFYVMTQQEMEDHRDKFAMAKNKRTQEISGPWRDHFEAMALKTVVRMLAKWMPKSTEFATGISADETVRVDSSADTDPAVASRAIEAGSDYSVAEEPTDEQGESRPEAPEPPE